MRVRGIIVGSYLALFTLANSTMAHTGDHHSTFVVNRQYENITAQWEIHSIKLASYIVNNLAEYLKVTTDQEENCSTQIKDSFEVKAKKEKRKVIILNILCTL